MSKLRIGFVLTGSFCTFSKVMPVIQALIERGDTVTPILSDSAGILDTRFGTAAHWREEHCFRGADWTGGAVLYTDRCSVHGQYARQTGARSDGHPCDHGGQKPSARRTSGRAGGLHQRRSVRQRRQSRHAAESPALLFRAAPAGCAAQQAALACRRYDADSRCH